MQPQTRDELERQLAAESQRRGKLRLLAPVVKNRKGFHTEVAEWAAKHGYEEIRADGQLVSSGAALRLDRFREHNVEIVTGVLHGKRDGTMRNGKSAAELIAETLELGKGILFALDSKGRATVHSTERACPKCGKSFEPLDPKNFSYNSPRGWCPRCRGFGELFYLPDVDRGAKAEAIEESWFEWQEGKRESCPDCEGTRVNPVARAVALLPETFSQTKGPPLTVDTFAALTVESAAELFRVLTFEGRARQITQDLIPEIQERLKFLVEVGLGYLALGRAVPTLSGGEAQRIRLAAQLGSNLSGVLYILDEPTIGLHARDNIRLLAALEKLRSRGNSVLVVEHDEETMRRADYIIDLGPGAGVHGGEVVASGTLEQLMERPESITGRLFAFAKNLSGPGKAANHLLRGNTARFGEAGEKEKAFGPGDAVAQADRRGKEQSKTAHRRFSAGKAGSYYRRKRFRQEHIDSGVPLSSVNRCAEETQGAVPCRSKNKSLRFRLDSRGVRSGSVSHRENSEINTRNLRRVL